MRAIFVTDPTITFSYVAYADTDTRLENNILPTALYLPGDTSACHNILASLNISSTYRELHWQKFTPWFREHNRSWCNFCRSAKSPSNTTTSIWPSNRACSLPWKRNVRACHLSLCLLFTHALWYVCLTFMRALRNLAISQTAWGMTFLPLCFACSLVVIFCVFLCSRSS